MADGWGVLCTARDGCVGGNGEACCGGGGGGGWGPAEGLGGMNLGDHQDLS